MKLKIEKNLIFLVFISILYNTQCYGIELDIAKSCKGSQSCILYDQTATYENPFVIIENSTQNQLDELVIRDSVLLRFPHELFEVIPNLHTLIMHNCRLNRISQTDFKNAKNLITLVLQHNRLSEIGEKIFSSLSSLKELRLGHNNIHMIHQEAFTQLTYLLHLDLQQNAIQDLNRNLFLQLKNLEFLDLSWNEITKIDASTFASNTKLKTLLLNNNKFIVFEPNSLEHLPHLNLLDVSNNFVEELNTQSVDTLYADNSSLKRCSIHGSIIKFHANNNELTELIIQDPTSVRELQLHGNHFESFNDFIDMINLQHLDVSKNLISTFANSHSSIFLSLPSLSYLNLSFNKLKNLTKEQFLMMPRLLHLDMACNHLIKIDVDTFKPLMKLEKLLIDGNGLHHFEYKEFLEEHESIKEIGINANAWDWDFMQEMIEYIESHYVHISQHYPASLREMNAAISITSIAKSEKTPINAEPTNTVHTSVCQCFSPNQEILSFGILCLVSLVLVLQIFRLVRERDSIPALQRCSSVRFIRQVETEPFEEWDSQV